MTTLLLKTKTELFEWLQQQLCNGEERQREKDAGSGQTQAENSDQLQSSIFVPSFQLKVHWTNCEQIALPSSSRACEHVHLNIYTYIK